MKEISNLVQTEEGVKIEITSSEPGVEKAVEAMVEGCATGKCDCMPEETKNKVSSMKFEKSGGKSAIFIQGKITVKEMENTIERSSKDQSCCC